MKGWKLDEEIETPLYNLLPFEEIQKNYNSFLRIVSILDIINECVCFSGTVFR